MGHKVVCIGRQFGSGGREIGMSVAHELGIECYDKRLITLAAEHGGLDHQKLVKFDEKRENPWLYEAVCEGNEHVRRGDSVSAVLFQLQSDVIRSIARGEDAVIIGRCADYVLRDMEGVALLTVFISAPFEYRVARKMELERIDQKKAEKLVRKIDKQRSQYYQSYAGAEWGASGRYDLYLDSSRFSKVEITARITDAYRGLEKS